MHGSEDEDNDLPCSQEALTISYENNSGSMQKKNEMDAWLTEKLNYLKKPVEVSNAVSELAIMYRGSSTDKIKRGVRDWRRETIQWSRQQDADLVAFAFYYANVANSMRNLEVRNFLKTCICLFVIFDFQIVSKVYFYPVKNWNS